jgi:hypothetical protein
MSQSDAIILEAYKTARDTLVAAIANEEWVVEIEIRGKRTKFDSPTKCLEFVESQIRYYASIVDAASAGSGRNYAQLRR